MFEFKDITFIIPVSIDSNDRMNNLNKVLNYLLQFDTNIFLYESDKTQKVFNLDKRIIYKFIQAEYFHRTKILNIMIKDSKTKIIANYDVDVLLKEEQILESLKLIEENDIVYPFNGDFLEISKEKIDLLKNDLSNLPENLKFIWSNSYGGAVFVKKEIYVEVGYENEYFKAWGYEDNERLIRFKKFNKKIIRAKGPIFHLEHVRNTNKDFYSKNETSNNKKMFEKIEKMNLDELKIFISQCNWVR